MARAATSTPLPAAITPSASRSFLMISSGVCLFFFMRVPAALRAATSHNFWISFRGALQQGTPLCLSNPSFVKFGVLRGSKNDFAKIECRETRVQRRELLPLLTFTLTLPCHAGSAQRVGGTPLHQSLLYPLSHFIDFDL